MNREYNEPMEAHKGTYLKMDARIKDTVLIALIVFILLLAVWQVFADGSKDSNAVASIGNESEKRVAQILHQIDGVGDVEVLIGESENGAPGVVIVCEGANDLRVVMDIREAVSAALFVEQENIKVYLKK